MKGKPKDLSSGFLTLTGLKMHLEKGTDLPTQTDLGLQKGLKMGKRMRMGRARPKGLHWDFLKHWGLVMLTGKAMGFLMPMDLKKEILKHLVTETEKRRRSERAMRMG